MQYPSAVAGLVIVIGFIIISLVTIIVMPYDKAVSLWRGDQNVWYKTPKEVPPAWFNWFSQKKLPETISFDTRVSPELGKVETSGTGKRITFDYVFDYQYDEFPQELSLFLHSEYEEKAPFVSILWKTPDQREIRIADFGIQVPEQTFIFSQDERLKRRLKNKSAEIALFSVPDSDPAQLVKGSYTVHIEILTFEPNSHVEMEFVQYGQVYGVAGTDHLRRDLSIALLWGLPVALLFGLLAAMGTSMASMVIAAVAVWFGGWLDEIIQRITEVNSVLPFLPILIMVGTFYSKSIFVILGVTILLSIFGLQILNYRAMFMQIREMPYIEAARAYGAGNARIIMNYLLPRIVPLIVPNLVTGIPTYVFLEASLAVLGLGDPVLPTWGKIIQDAGANGALYQGLYYWILEPSVLLMLTGLAFSMLGFALDRIFNPRLRGV